MRVDIPKLASKKLSSLAIVSLVGALTLAVFFRQQLLNHFTYLTGDPYDGVIQVALLEHWFNFFRGLSNWASPNYFFPYAKTLGYNEGLFLYGVIYSIFRAMSIDVFLSSELVNIVIKGIGFFGFFTASKKLLKLSTAWALLGAVIFTLSNNSFLQTSHAQLLSVALAPVEAVLIYTAYTALIAAQPRRFFVYGSLSAVWFGAWMLTCVYTAWFFVMFLALTMAVQLCLLGRSGLANLGRSLVASWRAMMGIAVIAAIALLPFAAIYFSPGNAIKHRPWEEILYYTPSLMDSVNVGTGNLLFGGIVEALKSGCAICDIGTGERETGISPLLFALAMMCVIGILTRKFAVPPATKVIVVSIALATTAMWLLSIHFGPNSGWYYIYQFWPGGSGLRVVARILLFLSMPITALGIYYLSRSTWPRIIILPVCATLVYAELNAAATTTLDRVEAIQRLSAITKPPASCKAFFVTESIDTVDDDPNFAVGSIYPHNVDAMLIAELVNLPTINGFASFNPPDWRFQYPTNHEYLPNVAQYAAQHGLQGLCRLDLIGKHWDTAPIMASQSPLGYWDLTSQHFPADILNGFDGSWSVGDSASFKFALQADANRKTWKVRIGLVTALANERHRQRVTLSVNGSPPVAFLIKGAASRSIALVVPAAADGHGELTMRFPDAISPKDLGVNGDTRKLAIQVKSIHVLQ